MTNLLAHLAHLEISSPDVEASVRFFEAGFGLREVNRDEDGTVYLRCWGDYYAYSVVVAPGAGQPSVGGVTSDGFAAPAAQNSALAAAMPSRSRWALPVFRSRAMAWQ
jgi:catechol 2,3-dioxygenase